MKAGIKRKLRIRKTEPEKEYRCGGESEAE